VFRVAEYRFAHRVLGHVFAHLLQGQLDFGVDKLALASFF